MNNIIAFNSAYGIYGDAFLAYNDLFFNSPDYVNNTPGTGSIGANPYFIDEGGRDFRLSFESPCIDAGHPHTQYLDPDGTRNDMGAIAFNQSVP